MSQRYRRQKDALVHNEQLVLRMLHFDTSVDLPYRQLLNYCKTLRYREAGLGFMCLYVYVFDCVCVCACVRACVYVSMHAVLQ